MDILVAHSEHVPLEEDWVYKTIHNALTRWEVVYDPSRVNLRAYEAGIEPEQFDGVIATIDRPDEQLDHELFQAHILGKGVLAFLPPAKDPALYLPSFAPYPSHPTEKRLPITHYISRRDDKKNHASIFQGYPREMKLKIWLGAQLMRLGQSAAVQQTEFMLEDADKKLYGAEADEQPPTKD